MASDSRGQEYDLKTLVAEIGDTHAKRNLVHLSGDARCFASETGSEATAQCRDNEELWVFGSDSPFTEPNFTSQAAKMIAEK